MNSVKYTGLRVKDFVLNNLLLVALVIAVAVLSFFLVKKESFDGMVAGVKSLAEFPESFKESLLVGQVENLEFKNYFKPSTEKVEPNSVKFSEMNLPLHDALVNVDIGNGLAVEAKVQVPSQVVKVPEQAPVKVPEVKKTDVLVPSQTVQIPAQTGTIDTKIAGSEESIMVPVEVPAQVVTISEQKAVIPVIEPFRM